MLSRLLGKTLRKAKKTLAPGDQASAPAGTQEHAPPEEQDEIPFAPQELRRLPLRKWILYYARKGGVGAEIGVFRGHFSAVLAEELRPTRLYLVDPWRKMGETFGWGTDSPYTGYGKLTTNYAREDTMRRVKKFSDIDIRFVEDYGLNFFEALDEKLDWVYIDSSHQYQATLTELRLASLALKEGGVILGDDWHPDPKAQHHGVFRAVRDFCRHNPYEIVAAGQSQQWCIRKTANMPAKPVTVSVADIPATVAEKLTASLMPIEAATYMPVSLQGALVPAPGLSMDARLVLKVAGATYPITWGLSSPFMEKQFPENPRAARARFQANGIILGGDGVAELFLDTPGEERLLLARITAKKS